MDELEKYIELNSVESSEWIRTMDAEPETPGKYMVIVRKRGRYGMNMYSWNGGYWVTAGGNPSRAVEAWLRRS